jgi:hypothetical protein
MPLAPTAALGDDRWMSNLAGLGVAVQQRFFTRGEVSDASTADRTELAYTLPKSTGVQATFSHENLATSLRKVFKKELQVGDPLFDEVVHIATENLDAAARLLESTDVRASIESLIVKGGALELAGELATFDLPGRCTEDDELATNVVRALLS